MAAFQQKLSLCEEILKNVTEPFTKVVCTLDDSKNITDTMMEYVRTKLGPAHWIDINSFYGGMSPKPKAIYCMFGEYFEKNDAEVWDALFKWVSKRKDEIEENIRIALRHKELSMNLWMQKIRNRKCVADELVIYYR